jgi:hypothetical protein
MTDLNVNSYVHPFYDPGYVIPSVGNLTEKKSYLVFLVSCGGVRLSPLGISTRMINDEREAVDGVRISKGNRSIRRKPALVPLCPPQIPHGLTWARTRAAAVGYRSYGMA